MINIEKIIEDLSKERSIFHSEADFQHAIAWKIHTQFKNASICLEFPEQIANRPCYLDLRAVVNKEIIAMELKYKTRALKIEKYNLKNQSAQDIGRYDFLSDIQRLEKLVRKNPNIIGYGILLTNDHLYWKESKKDTIDKNFRIHDGQTLKGKLQWKLHAAEGTTKKREDPINLRGYKVRWKDYSKPSNDKNGTFKYLLLKIEQGS